MLGNLNPLTLMLSILIIIAVIVIIIVLAVKASNKKHRVTPEQERQRAYEAGVKQAELQRAYEAGLNAGADQTQSRE
ncbi:hypothetical protein ACXR2W_06700 [Leucobacter sp. HY1908]